MPLLEAKGVPGLFTGRTYASLIRQLQAWSAGAGKPKAALIISAHYETDVPSIIGSNPNPPMLYVSHAAGCCRGECARKLTDSTV